MERWVCPFCNFAQIVAAENKQENDISLNLVGGVPSQSRYVTDAYACANPQCRRISLSMRVFGFVGDNNSLRQRNYLTLQVLPRSTGKPQPEYIPLALREDYEQACAIRDLSPKAAATLVRRCLQGMIRDFCEITDKRTLNDEIRALKALVNDGRAPSGVTEETISAIDHVRSIGNIGAHMEKDINLIVDIDANEAQVLIELVEMLFEDWYVARQNRQERLARIGVIANEKQETRDGPPKT
jgi:hypothetical protein